MGRGRANCMPRGRAEDRQIHGGVHDLPLVAAGERGRSHGAFRRTSEIPWEISRQAGSSVETTRWAIRPPGDANAPFRPLVPPSVSLDRPSEFDAVRLPSNSDGYS